VTKCPQPQCPQPQKRCVDVEAINQPDCDNTPFSTDGVLVSGAIAKIPVVLAELTVQINVDSTITLPEPALEIKQITKHLKLTQCLLLQNTNKLFLRGFIRKNIQFATRTCSNEQGVCGDIRHCTVDIPFSCVTPVIFNVTPPAPVRFNKKHEFQFFRTQDLSDTQFAEKDQLLSGDLSEFNEESFEFFNELPFCELIHTRIVEFDELINRTPLPSPAPFEEREFEEIEEKMVIDLTLKILQKRQACIPPCEKDPHD